MYICHSFLATNVFEVSRTYVSVSRCQKKTQMENMFPIIAKKVKKSAKTMSIAKYKTSKTPAVDFNSS